MYPVLSSRSARYFLQLAGFLRLLCLLCIALLARPVPVGAQEPEKLPPYYLSTTSPVSHEGGWKYDSCQMLGKTYKNSVSERADNSNNHELRYTVNRDYPYFMATIGISDTYSDRRTEFTYTLLGIDDNGREKPLMTSRVLQATQKPQDIAVPLKGLNTIILRVRSNYGYHDPGTAWWGEARFDSSLPTPPGPGPGVGGGKTIEWVFDEDALDKQMEGMITKLKADVPENLLKDEKLEVYLAPFDLKPLAGQKLADANVKTIQQAMRDALKQTKSFTIETGKKNLFEAAGKDWEQGDALSRDARSAMGETVTQRYAILGRVKDEDKTVRVLASLYDLKTGMEVAQKSTRIDVKARKQIGGGGDEGGVPAGQEQGVTFQFTADKRLNFHEVQWFVDEAAQGTSPVDAAGANATKSITLPKGKHKVKMLITGPGRKGLFNRVSYAKVNGAFDLEVTGDVLVEISAKYDEIGQRMSLTATAGSKDIPVSK